MTVVGPPLSEGSFPVTIRPLLSPSLSPQSRDVGSHCFTVPVAASLTPCQGWVQTPGQEDAFPRHSGTLPRSGPQGFGEKLGARVFSGSQGRLSHSTGPSSPHGTGRPCLPLLRLTLCPPDSPRGPSRPSPRGAPAHAQGSKDCAWAPRSQREALVPRGAPEFCFCSFCKLEDLNFM